MGPGMGYRMRRAFRGGRWQMRHRRTTFMGLVVICALAAAFSTAATAAPGATRARITDARLIKFCVRIDGSRGEQRGTVRIIDVDPTNLSWKKGQAPTGCAKNEQQLDWTAGTGATGATGPTGATGAPGATGATGAAGTNGTNGTNGASGATGATGVAGANGTNGTNGVDGATGATGVAGADGTNGTNGVDGATGATGVAGADGT